MFTYLNRLDIVGSDIKIHIVYFNAIARGGALVAQVPRIIMEAKSFDFILIKVHIVNFLKYMSFVALTFKKYNFKTFLGNLSHASFSAILDFIRTSDACFFFWLLCLLARFDSSLFFSQLRHCT